MTRPVRQKESVLKQEILGRLRANGYRVISNALFYKYFRSGLDPGSPDIVCVLPPIGVFVGLELKVGAETQSKTQIDWQKRHEELGGLYYIVYSCDEALQAMNQAAREIQSRINIEAGNFRRTNVKFHRPGRRANETEVQRLMQILRSARRPWGF
jgi:hypothetical protein